MLTNFFIANEMLALFGPAFALATGFFLSEENDKARALFVGQGISFASALLAMLLSFAQPSVLIASEQIFSGLLRFDALSCCLLAAITFIAFVVTTFSERYLGGDKTRLPFLTHITPLSSTAALLVLSGNIVCSLICWNLLSWGIWRLMRLKEEGRKSSDAVLRHHLISDMLLLAAVILVISWLGTATFSEMPARAASLRSVANFFAVSLPMSKGTLIAILLIAAFSIKSALFPFHRWLLATLDAPTPLSGLLHAGVVNVSAIMAYRTMPILQQAPAALWFWAAMAILSAVLGTLSMSAQSDVKRKLVYSTVGQMGFMSLQCACGAIPLAIFHVIAHGLFKCHMFLQSGSGVSEGLAKRSYFYGARAEGSRRANAIFIVASASIAAAALHYLLGSSGITALSAIVASAAVLCASPVLSRISFGIVMSVWSAIMLLAVGSGFAGKFLESLVPGAQNSAVLTVAVILFAIITVFLAIGQRLQLAKALYVHSVNGFYAEEAASWFSSWCGFKFKASRN